MVDNDFEIIEPDDYTPKEEEKYSHSSLIMSALKKVIENGSKEMRDGYWNTKFDRFGNPHKVYVTDTRLEFIESVESLLMIQERDFDDKITDNIKQIKESLKKQYTKYCEEERIGWDNLLYEKKQELFKRGAYFRVGMLSDEMPYKFEYIRDKVSASRAIVSEIQRLIKRLGDYQEELYEA